MDFPQIWNLGSGDQTKIKNAWNEDDPIEDYLKILKVEYLCNHWSDLPEIWNLSSGDQTKIKNAWNEDELQMKTKSKGRWPKKY